MSKVEELAELIREELMPEVEEVLDQLFELVANNKKATMDDKEEYKELQELHGEFKAILEDIENDDLEEDEAIELMDEIQAMRDAE